MVTTRSADKRRESALSDGKTDLSANVQGERLALRSKPDEVNPLLQSASTDLSASKSSKSSTGIVVNIPPLRKQAKLISDDAISGQVVETHSAKENQFQRDDGVTGDVSSISDLRDEGEQRTNEQEVNPMTTPSTKIDPTTHSNHKRFGSEDSNTRFTSHASPPTFSSNKFDGNESESGNDAPPEEVTTRLSKHHKPSRSNRVTRSKKSIHKAGSPQPAETSQPTPTVTTEIRILEADPTIEQELDSSVMVSANSSPDLVFVTAHTSRHVDHFATPQLTSSEIATSKYVQKSPTPAPLVSKPVAELSHLPAPLEDEALPMIQSSALLRIVKPSNTLPAQVSNKTRSVALPRKAVNTLEQYRQQKLRSRADKKRSRNGTITLQDDWPAKRRKFLVGF